ncbi:MAG: AMP-binding protein, partial [Acidobacteria bacterium]|nr:AMP-binding protein [Acidobacteriota bacterium]
TNEKRVTTVGPVIPEVEVKIIDPETGQEVASGEQGELYSRSLMNMKGYYKMPEATAAAIDPEGWLHTGDLATVDEEGYYKITGRLKDMIIRAGENVYPREIEEFLYTNPKVSDVQVIGVPDQRVGEEVMAWLMLKPGETATEEEVREKTGFELPVAENLKTTTPPSDEELQSLRALDPEKRYLKAGDF